ncbi:hypothetical protein HYPSUDRAFT_35669 [Hypholoma sublateritium FD-334 SS-4]|uniref:BRCT domain-containing protein n=1 Tax=Hypholoma sublateritium (strain FD-334 SS-4) TaxID=945553 RepID=A0A0D2P7Z2_HYPSF|nr:hypothetical protein HYPSUDRAFT_35669 [Hypholoma sublateritium FD-334 SS-4]
MNAFDQDDPDSSQATQMIQDLLEPHTSPSKSGSAHNLRRRPQNQQPNDISADSLPSSRTSHSIPQYHFHGLASTQTQSQHYGEDDEPQEGSQKENIGSVKTGKESPPSRPASPGPSSSRNSPAKPQTAERRVPAAPSTEKGTSKKATNVTFQSPRPKGGTGASTAKLATRSAYKPTPPPVSRYKQPPRPPIRTSSQDSFAYDPADNEGRLIATAAQFAIPLSELARGSSPSRDFDTSGGTSLDSMYHHNTRQQARPPPPSPPRGRVLVEATPSQSTDSQQSQPAEPAEPARKSAFQRLFPNDPGTHPAFESANLDRGWHAAYAHGDPGGPRRSASPVQIHPDLLATQSSVHDDPHSQPSHAQVETQPSTQFDDSRAPEPDIEEGATPFSLAQSVKRSTGATGASHRHSLLAMVAPQNQWRYRQYGNAQNSMPYEQPAPTPSIPPSELQETQPSFEAPPPRRGFPVKSLTATTAPSAPSLPSMIPVDSMEVVPDSEPARRGIQASPKKASPKKPAAVPQKAAQVHPAEGAAGKGKAVAVNEDSEMSAVDEEPQRVADAEDEDEEEIPLAVVAAAPKKRGRPPGKKNANEGKGKAVAAPPLPPPPSALAVAPKPKANPPSKTMQKPVLVPAMTGHSWENGEVPSSVPEQDLAKNTRNTRNRPAIIAEPKKKAAKKGPQSKQSSRSTSNAPRSVIQEEEEEEDAVIPSEHENEEGTEPADEDYQDADAGPSRKRKRASLDKTGVPVKGTRGGAAKRTKHPTATPATRASVKPAASTATRSAGSKGSRVFALWIQDGHYYPGTVHSTDNQQRYNIKFDDGTESWVTIDDMRACELRVGDDVLHDDRNRPSAISNVNDVKDGTVEILVDDQAETKQISELRIAHKTVMFSWNDRRMTPQTVSTTVKPVKKPVSPSPSKMSMVSMPSVRGIRKKVLSRTALVVTLAAGKDKWEKEKESLMNAVKNSGGFVIDDLNTIIKMDGRHALQGNRWTIRKADAKWIGSAEIGRLFLLADDANQKPKFLIALALGIPCLSTSWLEDSVESGKEREWAGYLLPQGYSTSLGARASQQVDVDWGNSIYHVTDIMNNRVACKLFAGKSILCIGQDMVCHPKGKRRAGSDDKTLEASNSVPRIILAMGAEVVEAVTEPRHASQVLSYYDYLVIREPGQYSPQFTDCTVVHWAWVKDCLIASRYLPLPTWAGAGESQ